MGEEKARRGAPAYYEVASVLLLLVLVGFSISGLWGVVRIAAPGVTAADYEYRQTRDLDTFTQEGFTRVGDRYVGRGVRGVPPGDTLTRAEVEDLRETKQRRALEEERRGGVQQILYWLIAVVVCLPLYIYHHRVVKQGRRGREEPPAGPA